MNVPLSDNEFVITVFGTVSAGKSTFINALIGKELLPMGNLPTTAKIIRIIDNDTKVNFSAHANGVDVNYESYDVDSATLRTWNEDVAITSIEIEGDIANLSNHEGQMITIVDMPGPNNSSDRLHKECFERIITDKRFHNYIIYVMDATSLAVDDDFTLLSMLQAERKTLKGNNNQVLFVLNKVDCLDEEKSESVTSVIQNVKKYLGKFDFENPLIVPVCSKGALILATVLNQKQKELTRSETYYFKDVLEYLYETNLSNYSPDRIKKVIKEYYSACLCLGEMNKLNAVSPQVWFERFLDMEAIAVSNIHYNSFNLHNALLATNIPNLQMYLNCLAECEFIHNEKLKK